jgi:hypothetical protein
MSETDLALAAADPKRKVGATLSLSPLLTVLTAALGIALFLLAQAAAVERVLDLALPDTDDIMRLLGVRDLLAGQSWFDTHQYRYLPPGGVAMHWSRLADAPLAAGIWLTPALGRHAAEATVVLAWPLLLFAVYLGLVAAVLRRIASPLAAAIAVLVAGHMVVLQYIFGVGRIDHHGLQIVLITAAIAPFASHRRAVWAPGIGGLFCGLSVAVGLETLPFVAVIGAASVLWWVLGEENARRDMLTFAFAFSATALLAFGAQTAPRFWADTACDMLSAPWLLLACGGAIAVAALALTEPSLQSATSRLLAAAAAGLALLGSFALAYPECLAGPYAMIPQPYRATWLDGIPEAQPGWARLAAGDIVIFQTLGPLFGAAIAAGVLLLRSSGPMRRLTGIMAGCLAAGLLLALLQVRGLYIVGAFVPPIAAVTIWHAASAIRAGRLPGLRATAAALAGLLFFSPIWLAPALAVRALVPVRESTRLPPTDCILEKNLSVLDRLPRGVLLAPISLGAHALLYTHHSIVAAGFHRAVEGIIAGIDAFRGSEADMRRIVRERAADYVVICADWAKAETAGPAPFARALAEGEAVSWLEPVALDAGALMVWRVRPEAFPAAP